MLLLYRRLFVICRKMERLVERFQSGRLRRGAPRPISQVILAEAGGETRRLDEEVCPRRFGWLVRLAAYQAAGYGSQLRAVLETPEMVALLVAAPQAARILSPLCRMLAVETSLLRPRPGGMAADDTCKTTPGENGGAVVRKPARVVRKPVDWGRIPLPRGVLAAARRQGVRKGR